MSDIKKLSETKHCTKHGDYVSDGVKRQILDFNHTWWTGCPECLKEADERELAQEDSVRERIEEGCLQALRDRGIRGRMLKMNFGTYHVTTPQQVEARDKCLEYADNPDGTLLLIGAVGTGKTHLGAAIATYDDDGTYTTLMKMVRNIRETYRNGEEDTEQERIDFWAGRKLLVLDEVGVQHCTDAERLLTYEVINDRYVEMLPTVLISNETIEGMTQVLGERTMDRLAENGRVVAFTWESYRRN